VLFLCYMLVFSSILYYNIYVIWCRDIMLFGVKIYMLFGVEIYMLFGVEIYLLCGVEIYLL